MLYDERRAVRGRNFAKDALCKGCGRIFGYSTLPRKTRDIYLRMERIASLSGGVLPTQRELADDFKVTRPTMSGHFKTLEALGYLKKVGKSWEMARYSAGAELGRLERELAANEIKRQELVLKIDKMHDATGKVSGLEERVAKQATIIRAMKQRLDQLEPRNLERISEEREALAENRDQAREGAQEVTAQAGLPASLQGEELP